ncbi:hypothetical protein IQ250_20700 [Pseudanabaenaceae cyanobacterium LEGE 13415]|nr:hypothetical protein [Pseudanabaenaceae cyanobacterium LEGE 13415]
MQKIRAIVSGLAAAVVSLPTLSACQSNTPTANTPTANTPTTSTTTTSTTTNTPGTVVAQQSTGTDDPCSVHLWDGKNFKDSDIVISGAGQYSNLRNLPGANGKNWEDEADSLKVGSAATVKAYKEENFKGSSVTYKPGTQHPKLSEEPSSLEITCK